MKRFYFMLEGYIQCAEMESESTYEESLALFKKYNVKPDGAVLGVVK